jgi:uncharacterized protein YeaO (DUF488 family)
MVKSLRLRVKRTYESPSRQDGLRFLVDRLWPRGLKNEACDLDGWLKELAPSDKLRRWFGHDPARWAEFQHRYFDELDERRDTCRPIAEQAQKKTVTLLYSARDSGHNNALALKTYLERICQSKGNR